MWASSQEVPIGEIDSAEGCSIPERISHGGCLVVVSVEFGRSVMSVGESPAPRQKNRWSSGLPRSSESPPSPGGFVQAQRCSGRLQGRPFLLAMEKCRRQSPPIAGAHSRPRRQTGKRASSS